MTDNRWCAALCVLPSLDLRADLAFYTDQLGFRMDTIYPADNPRVVELSGHGLNLRLDRELQAPPGTICLKTSKSPDAGFPGQSPSGTCIVVEELCEAVSIPATQHQFAVRELRDGDPWVIGRAGMQYRDLIPGRLGGSIIASHIRIPDSGPVPDMVHYHTIGFQLIYCYRGWVRLVYEDQGPAFILQAGDCVTQPPGIRHRVLESSGGLEVIEIGVPAEHVTTIDHHMQLPTTAKNSDRLFDGQRFRHFDAAATPWLPHRLLGYEQRDTGIDDATAGVASVKIVRPDSQHASPGRSRSSHDTDILFGFVLEGSVSLAQCGQHRPAHALKAGDAFTVPPAVQIDIEQPSADLSWLEVALPGRYKTQLYD